MVTAAIEAGRAAYEIYKGDHKLAHKKDDSPVTAADHAAEAIILERLNALLPDVPIIAEEEVAAGRVPAIGPVFFLVDPLDGTREFIAGRDEWTVNIALVRDAAPVLGVVYAPASGEMFGGDVAAAYAFSAAVAPGSNTTGARRAIHVRPVPDAGLTAVASRSHSSPETRAYLARYFVADMVSIGSSLKFCLVASARADLYPRLGTTMEWDTAAGHAVLASAGGSVVTGEGTALRYGKSGFKNPWFIASGPTVPLPVSQG
jgi:3'(2'), 5'-bisphosphate nucleotidase